MHRIINDLADIDLTKLVNSKIIVESNPDMWHARMRSELKWCNDLRVSHFARTWQGDARFTYVDLKEIGQQIEAAGGIRFSKRVLDSLIGRLGTNGIADATGGVLPAHLDDIRIGDPNDVHLWLDNNYHLRCIVEGELVGVILWESIIPQIISEVYFAHWYMELGEHELCAIYECAHDLGKLFCECGYDFAEHGTSLRYSLAVQRLMLEGLQSGMKGGKVPQALYTSNPMLAAENGLGLWYVVKDRTFSETMNLLDGASKFNGERRVPSNLMQRKIGTDWHLTHLLYPARHRPLYELDECAIRQYVDDYREMFGGGTWLPQDFRGITNATALKMTMEVTAVQRFPGGTMWPIIPYGVKPEGEYVCAAPPLDEIIPNLR